MNLVLYCKSYFKDFDRLVLLSQSIEKYNKNNIPFYISIPKSDIELFISKNIKCTEVYFDETIYICETKIGWIQQQIIKSNFWRLGLCENYVCLDSDSYFIKDFYINDFIAYDNVPYTVMHEQHELFEWSNKFLENDIQERFNTEKDLLSDIFKRKYKKRWDFGSTPVIWSKKVWQLLDENVVKLNNLTFEKLIIICPSEFTWYGEALLTFRPFEILPIQSLFKFFHYKEQYNQAKEQGYTEEIYSKTYFGICLQSNFKNTKLTF